MKWSLVKFTQKREKVNKEEKMKKPTTSDVVVSSNTADGYVQSKTGNKSSAVTASEESTVRTKLVIISVQSSTISKYYLMSKQKVQNTKISDISR